LAGGAAPADLDWRPQCSWGVGWRAGRPTAALDIVCLGAGWMLAVLPPC